MLQAKSAKYQNFLYEISEKVATFICFQFDLTAKLQKLTFIWNFWKSCYIHLLSIWFDCKITKANFLYEISEKVATFICFQFDLTAKVQKCSLGISATI